MLRGLVAFVFLTLTACASMTVTPDNAALCGPRPTDEEALSAIRFFVERAGFFDPGSVQVRDVRVEDRTAWYNGLVNGGGYTYGWQIAFEVNGKNRLGGYVGYRPQRILRTANGMIRW